VGGVNPPADTAPLMATAPRARTSIGELVRRSVEAYDPELEEAELEVLLRLLEDSQQRAMKALDGAERELAATEAYFAAKRARNGHHR
jgi:hypothetical protein